VVPHDLIINSSLKPLSSSCDNWLSKSQHYQKEKNVNNTMPIIIEFIENTNSKIQM